MGSTRLESQDEILHLHKHLSQVHREYLLERHGTIELEPLPSDDPADPYNWTARKKVVNLALISLQSFMAGFSASSVIPAFSIEAAKLGVSIQTASYLVSVQIIFFGISPFFWKPISKSYGRRPVFLLSLAASIITNIICAVLSTRTYGGLIALRCVNAFFISPATALGSGVVAETFFKHERGKYMGIWTLMTTLGPPSGPFFMGFCVQRVSYTWIFWTLAIVNGIQLALYIPFGPETRYIRFQDRQESTIKTQSSAFIHRVDPTPWKIVHFIEPLFLAKYTNVLLPSFGHGVIFMFTSVYLTILMPQVYLPAFHFDPQQLGLQFLGLMAGTILGEVSAGPVSDWWMNRRAAKIGVLPHPAHRLWLSWIGFVTVIIGLVVFNVQSARIVEAMAYNVTPIIGTGFAAFANQLITTVFVTYMVDCHPLHGAEVGTYVNLNRMVLGFVGPFFFPQFVLESSLGLRYSAPIIVAIIVVFSVLPIIYLQLMAWKRPLRVD